MDLGADESVFPTRFARSRLCRAISCGRILSPGAVAGGVRPVTPPISRAVTGRAPDASSSLSQDTALDLLSCRRRRHVIHYLKGASGRVSLRELVRHVAAWENGVSVEATTRDQRVRVYTALRQSHLPKLDDGGVVRFDADRGTVELTEAASELDVYLHIVPHDDIAWSTYYVGLGSLGLAFVAGSWLGIVPFTLVPPDVGTLMVTLVFTASALVHVYHEHRNRLGVGDAPPETRGGGVR